MILAPKGGFHVAGLGWQLLILLGCLSWSLGTIYHRNAAAANPPLMFVALQMLAGGLGLLLLAAIAREPFAFDWTPRAFAAFLFLTLASSCLAYSAYAWLTVHTTPVVVGSYGYVCPAVAALLGWLVLGETLSWVQIAGMAVILAGIALVTGYWQPLPRQPGQRDGVRSHEEIAAARGHCRCFLLPEPRSRAAGAGCGPAGAAGDGD